MGENEIEFKARGSSSDLFRSMRVAQIRALARVLIWIGQSRLGGKLVCCARDNFLIGPVLKWLLAFRGTFSSLEEARMCGARYVPASHEHPKQVSLHAEFAQVTRESDYPVLFFLRPIVSEIRTVFDLGGSIGNLFFQLEHHLRFSSELIWTVHDLPFKKEPMLDFIGKMGEDRIRFADRFSAASGADLFVVVGAIHFFEPKLADLLGQLDRLPRHVIVNRSPFSHGKDIVTVQDGGLWLNPCKLHSVESLVSGMRDLGYDLVASWSVNERSLRIPLLPEYNAMYSGFYFRLSGDAGDNALNCYQSVVEKARHI